MHSRLELRARLGAAALVVASTLVALSVRGQLLAADSGNPGPAEIARALTAVKSDPNLATERTIKTLRWRQAPESARPPLGWLRWVVELFMWLERSARYLIWTGAVILAAFLAAYIVRLVSSRQLYTDDPSFIAPTHVRHLDIRPEALPADIGAAVRALWDGGDRRSALALLYRGMLSRLVHVHGVPIRESSTEGDCLALAGRHLPDSRREYTADVVRLWQRSVYGGEDVHAPAVYALCDRFASALDRVETFTFAAESGS